MHVLQITSSTIALTSSDEFLKVSPVDLPSSFAFCLVRASRRSQLSVCAMAATHRHEQELKQKSAAAASKATDPVEKLRLKCLSRGASGIKGLARYRGVAKVLVSVGSELCHCVP